jgi:hypothetical protein
MGSAMAFGSPPGPGPTLHGAAGVDDPAVIATLTMIVGAIPVVVT